MKKILAIIFGLAVGAFILQIQRSLQLTSETVSNEKINTSNIGNSSVPNGNAGFSTIVSDKTNASSSGLSYDMALLHMAANGPASSADSSNLSSSDWVQLAVDLGGPAAAPLIATNTTVARFQRIMLANP